MNVIVIITDDGPRTDQDALLARPWRTLNGEACLFPYAWLDVGLCGPARTSLFTGQLARNHGVYTNLSLGTVDVDDLIFKWADDAGVRTGLIGKETNVRNGTQPAPAGCDTFRRVVQANPDEWDFDFYDGSSMTVGVQEYQTEWMLDQALTFIGGTEPYLLFLAPTLPHGLNWRAHYSDIGSWSALNYIPIKDPNISDKHSFWQALPELDGEALSTIRRTYRRQMIECNMLVRFMDGLLDAVDLSDTIVMTVTDGGLTHGEHNRASTTKNDLRRSSINVPMKAAGPGFPAGVITAPVNIEDITATICAALNITPGLTQDGIDLRDIRATPADYADRRLLHQNRNDINSQPDADGVTGRVSGTHYLYIRYADGSETLEMYDNDNDPHHLVNLVFDVNYDATRASLDADLDGLLA